MAETKPTNDSSASDSILVVEDDAFLQKILVMKLTKAGFNVVKAGDGEDAIKKMRELKPRLVLLDLILPKMDGFDVLYHVQTDKELKGTPIIILSNLAQDEDVARTKDLGALDFFVKGDLSINEVVRKVKEVYVTLLKK